jgi:sugar lactone lactonase YvrE
MGRVIRVLLILAVVLYGCSGGSGSGDVAAPAAAITFPGETALISSGRVTVRGTAKDQSAITRVRVNGIDATSSDGFATWQATLDLPAGTNSLTVGTEDILGNRNTAAAVATLTVGPPLENVRGIVVEATGQLVIADGNRVVRVDPGSGVRTIVSDETTGSGPPITGLVAAIAVEATGQLVVGDSGDSGGCRLLRVDPGSGARTIVSGATTGSGPNFVTGCTGIAVEATGHIVVAAWNRIMRVDPGSGARTIVSDGTSGTGPGFSSAADIAVEATGQLVVVDGIYPIGRVLRVDPTSGARAIVSDATTGSGPAFGVLWSLAVEATGQLVVADGSIYAADRVVRVDPNSGARTIVSDTTTGSGPAIAGIKGIAVEATGQLVIANGTSYPSDPAELQRVMRVDPTSGARTIVADSTIGSGPILGSAPRGIAVEATGQIVILENGNSGVGRVVRVDPRSGARTIVADAATGSGPILGSDPRGIAVEPTGWLVVADGDSTGSILDPGRVVRVDPTSGARTIVSGTTTGTGPIFHRLTGIAVEPTGQIVVVETDRVLRVDPGSGARTIVSDATTGSGPPLSLLYAITVEPSGQLVVAGGGRLLGESVVRVDPTSGARTVLSSLPGPTIPMPGPIHGIGTPTLLGIAVEATGQFIVVDASNVVWGRLVRIDPITGVRTIVSDTVDFGSGIAVETSGQLIALSRQSVVRVDPRNGTCAIISQ